VAEHSSKIQESVKDTDPFKEMDRLKLSRAMTRGSSKDVAEVKETGGGKENARVMQVSCNVDA
jgi:hypothetical protein